MSAVEQGGDVPALVAQLKQVGTEKRELEVALAGMQPIPRPAPQVIASRLDEWRKLLRSSTTQARAVLDRVLVGRIVFTPYIEGNKLLGYTFEAPTRFDKLFQGIAVPRLAWIATGDLRCTEHLDIEDTMEGDFGRLLARAQQAALQRGVPGRT